MTVRKLAALVALLAAAVLLFVVVCPITPTPTAVITARNTAPVTVVTIAVAVAAILPLLVCASLIQLQSLNDESEALAPLQVLHRTCVHLC